MEVTSYINRQTVKALDPLIPLLLLFQVDGVIRCICSIAVWPL